MGNRLSKIYTRTGDNGTTALADGRRVSKADLVFVVMGDIDELNSHIGMVSALVGAHQEEAWSELALPCALSQKGLLEELNVIGHLLFNIGGELAMPEFCGIDNRHLKWLEDKIDAMNAHLPPLKDFILPKGSQLICQVHIARSVARRAERQAVQYRTSGGMLGDEALKFINRLSDYLFVLSRAVTSADEVQETLWNAQILAQNFED